MVSNLFMPNIYANNTSVSFIDFYENADAVELSMDSMTIQDYYAMFVYMSNWFVPGETTLNDLIDSSSEFQTTFADVMNKSGDASLQAVITQFGEDFKSAINTGDCTLVLGSSTETPVTGRDFLFAMMSAVDTSGVLDNIWRTAKTVDVDPNDESTFVGNDSIELKSNNKSKLYFKTYSNNNLTFDFSSPAYKAAIQVLFSVNPYLFINADGIVSIERFFVDAVGNIWGITEILENDPLSSYDANSKTKNTVLDSQDVYLILPACLNPSTFSTSGTSAVAAGSGDLSNARFPLMNRFALSAVVTEKLLGDSFSENMVPIYNLLAGADGTIKNRLLNIFGVHSLSGYFLKTGAINLNDLGSWDKNTRQGILADFIYNPDAIKVQKGSQNGLMKTLTNAGVIVSVNPGGLSGFTNTKLQGKSSNSGNYVLDTKELSTLAFPFVGNDIKEKKNGDLKPLSRGEKRDVQNLFASYLLSPVFLGFNNISMNFYDFSSNSNESRLGEFLEFLKNEDNYELTDYSSVQLGSNGLSANDLALQGLQGFSLFLNQYTINVQTDGGEYTSVSPTTTDSNTKSFLWNLLESNIPYQTGGVGNTESFELFKKIAYNSESSGVDIIDTLILRDTLSSKTFKDLEVLLNNNGLLGDISVKNSSDVFTLKVLPIKFNSLSLDASFYILPQGFINIGNNNKDIALSPTLGLNEMKIRRPVASLSTEILDFNDSGGLDGENVESVVTTFNSASELTDYILALYGYKILTPSAYFENTSGTPITFKKLLGKDLNKSGDYSLVFNTKYFQGMYLGYIVDMMGITSLGNTISMGNFNTKGLLPRYDISAKGGNMSETTQNTGSGVDKSEDLSFQEKQKDLINRIYGLTNDKNNDYRNNLIKNIIEGFFLTVHRTITGTWGSKIGTISTGSSNSYDSLAGFIYTPTLEELSFTATLMNNYIKIYVFCMMFLIFIMVLMVLLHMRTWQQGLLTLMFMSVGLLFPYVLISNTINIGNRISNNIYSDRFDFWAMSEHLQSEIKLQGYDYLSESDQWLVSASVTSDDTYNGQPGVKVRWMSPKKVDMFNNLYSDADMSDAFVTNTQIFKWLFSSFIYDSEFDSSNPNASYVYRPYNSLALEANSYYEWGDKLMQSTSYNSSKEIELRDANGVSDSTYSVTLGLWEAHSAILAKSGDLKGPSSQLGLLAGAIRQNSKIYESSTLDILRYTDNKIENVKTISQFNYKGNAEDCDTIGTWQLYGSEVSDVISAFGTGDKTSPGIYSNLPQDSVSGASFDKDDVGEIGKAVYLKNTESPFYYFYSVLKMRYQDGEGFKKALLNEDIFRITPDTKSLLIGDFSDVKMVGAYRDFLDLEGLFEYVIPYLKAGNDYVEAWQSENGSEIETYAFEYELKDDGTVDETKVGTKKTENGAVTYDASAEYQEAVVRKNAMNRVWNMYCPWVDSLYDTDRIYNVKVSVGGKNIYINDSLDPSSYIVEGRPMIFSDADMIIKGYRYSDLTDTERKLQAVTENTYKDLMYLINYYDMDDEVLLVAAAMYATFNFNTEFSQDKFLDESVVLYPQGFELKNFNYDAYMRLALLNSTGETVFATDDLYTRILAKTSMFTGLLLLLCDVLACIAIPMAKFVILVALLFLGILVCIACVVNPPDKIFEAISKSVVLPTFLFLVLNVVFAYVMSFIVGEGLTAYVGSKGINFATNDPTITLLVMSLLSMAYLVCAWKVIKLLIDAYKKFGMSTALATVGVIGSAMVGFATAGKGNRLAGAFEGGHLGAKGVIDRRIRDKRYQKLYGEGGSGGGRNRAALAAGLGEGAGGGSKASTEFINKKASKAKGDTAGQASTNSGGVATEADRQYTNDLDPNATGLAKILSTGVYAKSKVKDAIAAGKHKKEMRQEIKTAKKLDREEKGTIRERGSKYLQKSLEQTRQHAEYHDLKLDVRASERSDEKRYAQWSNQKRSEAVSAKKGKTRKVDTQY